MVLATRNFGIRESRASFISFEFTDEHLAILVLLEVVQEENTTGIMKLLQEGYGRTKLSTLKASRNTIDKRITHLTYNNLVELKKDRNYHLTEAGQGRIKFTSQTIGTFKELFEELKA
ncbi:MAG: hypothetical protein ACXAEU_02630 [Candidatus Hodarchaeales archaeon]